MGGRIDRAVAGAFLLPEGSGQFIAGVGYAAGSRRFDAGGRVVPAPTARKLEASGYLEYGFNPWLSLILAPTLARSSGVAANSVTGSDGSAFGARLRIAGTEERVIALQVLVQPPVGGAHGDARAQGAAIDLRLMAARSFALWGRPAFADIQPGVRIQGDARSAETRLDVTFGLRPAPSLLVLLQDFNSLAPSGGPRLPSASYSKVQASLVYDLGRRWSLQAGAFRTIAGRNAERETGPMAALWYRF